MADFSNLEDNERAIGEVIELRQAAFNHAWNWWKYHAQQRITLVRFYIISLGGIAAAIGILHKQNEHFLAIFLSLFGAFLSFCFLRPRV